MKSVNFDFAFDVNLEVGDIIIKDGLQYNIKEITANFSYDSEVDITYKADLCNFTPRVYVQNGFVLQEEYPSITFTSFDLARNYGKSQKDTKEENIKEWVDLLYG